MTKLALTSEQVHYHGRRVHPWRENILAESLPAFLLLRSALLEKDWLFFCRTRYRSYLAGLKITNIEKKVRG